MIHGTEISGLENFKCKKKTIFEYETEKTTAQKI